MTTAATRAEAPQAQADERELLVSRAGVVGAGTLLSRLLGLGRDVTIAALFDRAQTDAFWIAFTIPTALRQLLAEGAVTSAALPILSGKLATEGEDAAVVVTPIGGQGFLFGRGNQQLSPELLARVGRERLVVVATEAKLAALGGRPLLVDTGDPAVDAALAGYLRVITGPNRETVYRVAADPAVEREA